MKKLNIPEDPFIQELLPEFVDTWINDLDEKYHEYLDKKDSDEMYRLAHTLKGSCFQFGLDDIANKGIELMGYAKNNQWDKAAEMEAPIKKEFQEIKQFLTDKGLMQ